MRVCNECRQRQQQIAEMQREIESLQRFVDACERTQAAYPETDWRDANPVVPS